MPSAYMTHLSLMPYDAMKQCQTNLLREVVPIPAGLGSVGRMHGRTEDVGSSWEAEQFPAGFSSVARVHGRVKDVGLLEKW
jgi:hypothetical protein